MDKKSAFKKLSAISVGCICICVLLIIFTDVAYNVPKANNIATMPQPVIQQTPVRNHSINVKELPLRLCELNRYIASWKRNIAIQVQDEMIYRALKHLTSTDNLKRIFTDVLKTNRTVHIGIVGGSISARKFSYGNVLSEGLHKLLGVPVKLHNAAIGATDSRYYVYCINTHLNTSMMDIILWEFAVNDFIKHVKPYAQEELTPVVLDFPNSLQLIYVNFVHGAQMRSKSPCINNENVSSTPLSLYYNIPSISMPDALCPTIMQGNISQLVESKSDAHPNKDVHILMGIFLLHFCEEVFVNLTKSHLSSSDLPLNGHSDLHNLPKALFNETIIYRPKCWSSLRSNENTSATLEPTNVHGWKRVDLEGKTAGRTDNKVAWESNSIYSNITFSITVNPYQNLKCSTAIGIMGCPNCGKVAAYIDFKNESEIIVDGKWNWKVTLTFKIAENIRSGPHNLTLIMKEAKKYFRIIAIMTSYHV